MWLGLVSEINYINDRIVTSVQSYFGTIFKYFTYFGTTFEYFGTTSKYFTYFWNYFLVLVYSNHLLLFKVVIIKLPLLQMKSLAGIIIGVS